MAKKPLAWYVLPGVLVASVTALGAVGTLIVKGAKYIELPEAMAGVQQKNVEQDKWLDKLSVIAEQNQKILDTYANAPQRPPYQPLITFVGYDRDGTCWTCNAKTEEACWEEDEEGRNGWRRCNPK